MLNGKGTETGELCVSDAVKSPPGPQGGAYAQYVSAALLAGTVLALVSARLTPAALFILLALFGAFALRPGSWRELVPQNGPVLAALAAFIALAFLSTLWAEAGSKALGKLTSVAAIMATGVILTHAVLASDRNSALKVACGLGLGFAVGLGYLLVEVATGQSI